MENSRRARARARWLAPTCSMRLRSSSVHTLGQQVKIFRSVDVGHVSDGRLPVRTSSLHDRKQASGGPPRKLCRAHKPRADRTAPCHQETSHSNARTHIRHTLPTVHASSSASLPRTRHVQTVASPSSMPDTQGARHGSFAWKYTFHESEIA